jgi:TonB family protein
MFDELVVSSHQRRKRTTAKYFLATGALYVVAIACAFCVSVLISDPKLADTNTLATLISPMLPPALGTPGPDRGKQPPTRGPAKPDIYNVESLDRILKNASSPPVVRPVEYTDDGNADRLEGPYGVGSPFGVKGGHEMVEPPPPRPDPPTPRATAPANPVLDNRPVRISSSVLQGKALERRKPIYPTLAHQIRLQGNVSIEVMIAPDGRVESARIVSGHPMLADKAREAAMQWRFQPTLLNNVPVRVTGVIVFSFKLNE